MYTPRLFKAVTFLMLLASWVTMNAQESDGGTKWSKGNIILGNGQKITGLCSYNDLSGIISFKSIDRDTGKQTFHRSEILGLEYIDMHQAIVKKYYTLTLLNKKTNLDESGFYEMLKEYEDFALVSKKIFVYSEKIINTTTGIYQNPRLFLRQYEQFYFLDKDGNIEPYMSVERNYLEDRFYSNQKRSGDILNKDLLPRYLGTYWPEMEQYLKDTGLRVNDRSSLLQAFDYYDQLLTEPVLNFPPGMISDTISISIHERRRHSR